MSSSILKIVLCFVVLTCNSYSQFYADSMISGYVKEFMRIADEETKTYNGKKDIGLNKEFSDDEINNIARIYYKACDEDPVGFNTYLENEHKKWNFNRNSLDIKPAMKKHLIVKKIA